MKMFVENMPDFELTSLSLAILLLLTLIFLAQLILLIGFFVFCNNCKKTTMKMEKYVGYILEDETKEEEAVEEKSRNAADFYKTGKEKPQLSKSQQEALLQEMLGNFL